jgi:hypothetical protein
MGFSREEEVDEVALAVVAADRTFGGVAHCWSRWPSDGRVVRSRVGGLPRRDCGSGRYLILLHSTRYLGEETRERTNQRLRQRRPRRDTRRSHGCRRSSHALAASLPRSPPPPTPHSRRPLLAAFLTAPMAADATATDETAAASWPSSH